MSEDLELPKDSNSEAIDNGHGHFDANEDEENEIRASFSELKLNKREDPIMLSEVEKYEE